MNYIEESAKTGDHNKNIDILDDEEESSSSNTRLYNNSQAQVLSINNQLKINPYNINNKLITKNDIMNIFKKCGVDLFHDLNDDDMELFQKAFIHKSYCLKNYEHIEIENNHNNYLNLLNDNYERLEFLGDKVLKSVIGFYLVLRYPDNDEGFMTKLQAKIENKNTLYNFSKVLGFKDFIIISKHVETSHNGRDIEGILEDVFESFVGSLFKSRGYDITLQFVIFLIENYFDITDKLYNDNNYKDQLLKVFNNMKWKHPKYTDISHENGKFISCVHDGNNRPIGYGKAGKKKDAEQNASKMALITLKVLKSDQYSKDDIFYPGK